MSKRVKKINPKNYKTFNLVDEFGDEIIINIKKSTGEDITNLIEFLLRVSQENPTGDITAELLSEITRTLVFTEDYSHIIGKKESCLDLPSIVYISLLPFYSNICEQITAMTISIASQQVDIDTIKDAMNEKELEFTDLEELEKFDKASKEDIVKEFEVTE